MESAVARFSALAAALCLAGCSAGDDGPEGPPITAGTGAVTQGGTGGGSGANPPPTAGATGSAGMLASAGTGGGAGGGGQAPSGGAGGSGGGMAELDAAVPDDAAIAPDATAPSGPSVIVPSANWTCGMPEGIPFPEGEPVLEFDLELGTILELGQTQYGQRRVLPIEGGTFSGPELNGTVMSGGLDWELTLPSGAVEVEARLLLQASGGARIYLRVCGIADGDRVRIVPGFEAASSGAHAWLNTGTFVGTREVGPSGMRLVVYRASGELPAGAPRIMTPSQTDPTLKRQAWDCGGPAAPANMQAEVLQAQVRIGSILSIGQSKYGSRTVIPITGGTFSGEVDGDVIPGGADFQLTPPGGSLQIEARYTLRTDDGELISVRNCGGGGGTTPQFETRRDGPYAFLTEQNYSGTIGLGIGGVVITVYRAQ